MEIRKKLIADNILTLSTKFSSLSEFARKAQMAVPTLTTFLKRPEERNITLDHLYAIADTCKTELWTLFVREFPFAEMRMGEKAVTKISPAGYRLLVLFEQATPDQQKSLLDYVSYQLKDSPGAERKVRETQTRYYPMTTYPKCDENHD